MLLSLSLLLWAGGTQDPEAVSTASPSKTGFTVVDSLERSVSLPGYPERIVQAGSSAFIINHALFLFPEARQRVVAMADGNQGRGTFLALTDSSYGEKTIMSRRINMEEILSVKPDLVVLKDFLFNSYDQEFQKAGIPVIYLNLETPEGWNRDLEVLGQLFGNPEKAEELKSYFAYRINNVTRAVKSAAGVTGKKVLILNYSEKEGIGAFQVPPLTYIQTTMLKMAGGDPVWKDADLGKKWTKAGFEQIAAWDPDMIFLISYRTPISEVLDLMEKSGYWKDLRAFKEKKIYPFPMDFHSWDQPDPRWLLGLEWMAGKISPEALPDLDMTREARDFYSILYGISEETFQEKILPLTQELAP